MIFFVFALALDSSAQVYFGTVQQSTDNLGAGAVGNSSYAGYFNGDIFANQDLEGLQDIKGLNSLQGLQTTGRLEIFSGSDDTDGAYFRLYADNHSTSPGDMSIVAGQGSGGTAGSIKFFSRTSGSYIQQMAIRPSGNVEIGSVSNPTAKLHIRGDFKIQDAGGSNQIHLAANGFIHCRQLDVDLVAIADYVFNPDYPLMPLDKLQSYITENHHLPGIKSASEYEALGRINLGELNGKLLEKVEELTLYVLELKNEIEIMKETIKTDNE